MKWTTKEIDILVKRYPEVGKEVCALLPNHTSTACIAKAKALKLRVKTTRFEPRIKWSAEELQILTLWYPVLGAKVSGLLPGRSETACITQAHRLGISVEQPTVCNANKLLSDYTEKSLLQSRVDREGFIPKVNIDPTEDSDASNQTINNTVYSYWTDNEVAILTEYYATEGYAVKARLPGRSKNAIYSKVCELGLSVNEVSRRIHTPVEV